MLYHRRKLLQVCSESSIPEIRKIGKFLENIPNIKGKCYSPLGWPVAGGNLGGGWCGLGPVVFPFYLYSAVVVVGSLGWCLVVRVWWRCCEAPCGVGDGGYELLGLLGSMCHGRRDLRLVGAELSF